jgi:hypothetical protein
MQPASEPWCPAEGTTSTCQFVSVQEKRNANMVLYEVSSKLWQIRLAHYPSTACKVSNEVDERLRGTYE